MEGVHGSLPWHALLAWLPLRDVLQLAATCKALRAKVFGQAALWAQRAAVLANQVPMLLDGPSDRERVLATLLVLKRVHDVFGSTRGLTDDEFDALERRYHIPGHPDATFCFPPDLRLFLSMGVPPWAPPWAQLACGVYDTMPTPEEEEVRARRLPDVPSSVFADASDDRDALFEVCVSSDEEDPYMGRPRDPIRRQEVCNIEMTPNWHLNRMLPICAHRMMPSLPRLQGNPVYSLWRGDNIVYGYNLWDWLVEEFTTDHPSIGTTVPMTWIALPSNDVPLWSDSIGRLCHRPQPMDEVPWNVVSAHVLARLSLQDVVQLAATCRAFHTQVLHDTGFWAQRAAVLATQVPALLDGASDRERVLATLGRLRQIHNVFGSTRGLTDDEFDALEQRYRLPDYPDAHFRFPPDLRLFLSLGVPPWSYPWAQLASGALDEEEEEEEEEEEQEEEEEDDEEPLPRDPVRRTEVNHIECNANFHVNRLIPIRGHRMMATLPRLQGNPVYSMYDTDNIVYGSNLWVWLNADFADHREALAALIPPTWTALPSNHVPHWSEQMEG